MTFDEICETCRALPGTTEDVKWGNNLVFSIGGKMYAVLGLDTAGLGFKCTPERFEALIERPGIVPARYLARAQWVNVEAPDVLADEELTELLAEARDTVFRKLPKRVQASI